MSRDQLSLLSMMGFRRCIRCAQEKPVADFAWREKAKGRRFAHCRACQANYHRKHYAENRAKYLDRIAARKQRLTAENRLHLLEFLHANRCADCGETDVVVLEFDHLRDKRFEISKALRDLCWDKILEEIAKCDVVCGNCHRRRTAARQGSVRAVLSRGPEL